MAKRWDPVAKTFREHDAPEIVALDARVAEAKAAETAARRAEWGRLAAATVAYQREQEALAAKARVRAWCSRTGLTEADYWAGREA